MDWFLPGYRAGGPIRSVANLVQHLGKEYQFSIITSDRDLGMNEPYSRILVDSWIEQENYRVIYLSPGNRGYKAVRTLVDTQEFDLIYLNSLFSVPFSLYPLWASRRSNTAVILAPRGMLGSGALSIKPLKKHLFLSVFNSLKFHKRVIWQATATTEKEDIIKVFGPKIDIVLAPNLSEAMGKSFEAKDKRAGRLAVFFLSRISAKKNLLVAIKALAKTDPNFEFEFSIIGPVEDQDYWNKCELELERLPEHVQVKLVGEVPHWEISEQLRNQQLLLLPTLNENYGHVIVEAWQNGCPVLISDQTPWRDLKNKMIGKVYPLSQNANFVQALNHFAQMNGEEFNRWSEASYRYARSLSDDRSALDQNRKLLDNQRNL